MTCVAGKRGDIDPCRQAVNIIRIYKDATSFRTSRLVPLLFQRSDAIAHVTHWILPARAKGTDIGSFGHRTALIAPHVLDIP